jgi:hypothetical protein
MSDSHTPDQDQPAWRRRRVRALAAGSLAAVAGAAAALLVATGSGGQEPPAVPPPTAATRGPTPGRVTIPAGFLEVEEAAAKPLDQPGVRWVRSEEPGLTALVSPCGGSPPSDRARVGGRQVALVGPSLWKVTRLVVYRDVAAARRAMSERRAALRACRRHRERDGAVTVWSWQRLAIGDEAMFVTSQRFRGEGAVPGSHRGVLTRQGRAVVMFVDFGARTQPSPLAEVARYQRAARATAAKLAAARWAQAP